MYNSQFITIIIFNNAIKIKELSDLLLIINKIQNQSEMNKIIICGEHISNISNMTSMTSTTSTIPLNSKITYYEISEKGIAEIISPILSYLNKCDRILVIKYSDILENLIHKLEYILIDLIKSINIYIINYDIYYISANLLKQSILSMNSNETTIKNIIKYIKLSTYTINDLYDSYDSYESLINN